LKMVKLPVLLAVSAMIILGLAGARTTVAASTVAVNSGFYDHQIIQYEATAEITSSPKAAQLIAHGNVVYHIVGSDGVTPTVQCVRLLAALPEVGYTGGAWNLQVFHWKQGVTPTELSKDDDINAAVASGLGTLEITSTLVRCPVVDFASLR